MIEELFDLDKTILKEDFLIVYYHWDLLIDLNNPSNYHIDFDIQ